MPQAMPLNWLSLYNFFMIIFFIIIIKMYFNQYKTPNNLKFDFMKKYNWKW